MSYLSHLKTAAEMHVEVAAAAKARRLALNVTQDELSERSGVSIATLRRFEAGGPAAMSTVLAIAESLGSMTEFSALFPPPKPKSLDDLQSAHPRRRGSRQRKA